MVMAKNSNTQTNRSQYAYVIDTNHAWTYDLYMSDLVKNIKRAMLAKGISEPELATRSGIAQPSIWRILHANQDPRGNTVKKIAKGLGISEEELYRTTASQEAIPGPDSDYLPVMMGNFHLEAGVTGFTIDYINENKPPIFFLRSWFLEHRYNPERLIACKVKGSSMEPNLFSGDVVIVNMDSIKPIDGKVFAVNYEGELVIKRMVLEEKQWYLSSDNSDKTRYPRKICSGEHCIILGQVIYKQSSEI